LRDDATLPVFRSFSPIWNRVSLFFTKSLLKQGFHAEQHTGGFQTTGDPAWLTRADIGAGVWSTLKPGAMLLAAVTPRGLAGEEKIVEITPMIGAGVGRIDGERLHGVDRLEDLLDLWPTP
jgi:hypothetical protein